MNTALSDRVLVRELHEEKKPSSLLDEIAEETAGKKTEAVKPSEWFVHVSPNALREVERANRAVEIMEKDNHMEVRSGRTPYYGEAQIQEERFLGTLPTMVVRDAKTHEMAVFRVVRWRGDSELVQLEKPLTGGTRVVIRASGDLTVVDIQGKERVLNTQNWPEFVAETKALLQKVVTPSAFGCSTSFKAF